MSEMLEFDNGTFPILEAGDVQGLSLRALCNHMGVSFVGQKESIERSPWSETCVRVTHAQVSGDTQSREHFVIDLKAIPMWLATITASRLKNPDARERVERWQREAAGVLWSYVSTGVAVNPDRQRFSDKDVEAEVQRQLQKRQYKEVVRDSLKAIGTEPGWQYGEIHNVLLVAITGMKAPALLAAGREIQTWKGVTPTKADKAVATNYLFADELELFNLVTDAVAVDLRFRKPRTYREFLVVVHDAADRYTA